jgi:hypothetical protein
MRLLDPHNPEASATGLPAWSLTLPAGAGPPDTPRAAKRSRRRSLRFPRLHRMRLESRWTCVRCGSVHGDLAAAARHIAERHPEPEHHPEPHPASAPAPAGG